MFRLSKKTEYSILALRHLHQSAAGTATVREIAETCRIPLALLAKLMQRLAKAGMVQSLQGVNGGYCLERRMDGINLAEVMEAVEGPFGITACGARETGCERAAFCDFRGAVRPLQRQIFTYLQSVTLADLERTAGL
ncbi:MAG TPA: Rrf2 family transcriptional regulator [bacterium]|nr:Rrf2 family transcriptional regulator [bacterium]HQG44359.1 Rrf2 family transcriptional regulator [bacterium]HQI47137.1 Rrf2 family transcriptional regulator [bacterium]HQJ63145.1 Rrf2 family transcriptional regulator [bacterium]